MGALDSDFNNQQKIIDHDIDEVIRRLETAAQTHLEELQDNVTKAKIALASGEAVQLSGETGLKDFNNTNNALVLARGLKDAGFKTISLDPETPMLPQIIDLKKQSKLSMSNWLRLKFDL